MARVGLDPYGQPIIQQNVGFVVMAQPGALVTRPPPPPVVWMPKPSGGSGCPPGLEYLTTLDKILLKEEVNYLEMATNFVFENRYRILNDSGQQVYTAQEGEYLSRALRKRS
ncbi:hypothetical protein DPMN_062729 [Dreissena polymorpha]|uniref:Phospholipid scramblase n=1 Tax=Dreissena polymorpha TaxID=45954 RepID=A0A9D4C9P8_DREPO|nr:hypothetical protein DPMN_062729 [Dreissena polymorpha]